MFRAVQDSLIDYATVETTDVILRRIAKLDEKFLTIADYHMYTDELKLNLDEKFDTKLSITDFNENITQLEDDMGQKMDPISNELEAQKKTMRKLQGEFADVIEVTNSQTELLKTKVDYNDLDKIWMQFDRYCAYDDLKDLYKKTVAQVIYQIDFDKQGQQVLDQKTQLIQ